MKLKLKSPKLTDQQQKELARWKEARKGKIGGSTAAIAAGMGKRGSRVKLWGQMRGQLPEEDLSEVEYVYWGNVLEPTLLRELERQTDYILGLGANGLEAEFLGLFYFKEGGQSLYSCPGKPKRIMSPDGFARKSGGAELVLVEAKAVGLHMAGDWKDDEPPEGVIIQCQHGMGVFGLDMALVPVLLGGQKFEVFGVPRDQALIDALFAKEDEFLWHVEENIMPPVESEKDLPAIKALHPDDNGERIELPHDAIEIDGRRVELLKQKKNIDYLLKLSEAQLRQWIGKNTYAVVPGTQVEYSLKTTPRKEYEVKSTTFRALHRKEKSK